MIDPGLILFFLLWAVLSASLIYLVYWLMDKYGGKGRGQGDGD